MEEKKLEDKFCQSCGMPLTETNEIATNEDGTLNEEYCIYCFRDGEFTDDCTMEEMIEISVQHLDEMNKESGTNFSEEEARNMMISFFPELKRWKRKNAGE